MGILIGIHVAICIFLVGVILLQPGKSDTGIGFGSSSQSIFGSRGAGNFLTKTTSICAFVFIATSFFLTYNRVKSETKSVISADAPDQAPQAPAPTATPAASAKPADPKVDGAQKKK